MESVERQPSSTMDVTVSLEDARLRMCATTDVARHAAYELGRLVTHQAGEVTWNLRAIGRAVGSSHCWPLVTPDVEKHLIATQQAYLDKLAVVQANAHRRIVTLADWTPPRIGLGQRFLRLLGSLFFSGRERLRSPLTERVTTTEHVETSTGGSTDDVPSSDSDRPDDGPDQHRYVHEYGFESQPVAHSNGTSSHIGGSG